MKPISKTIAKLLASKVRQNIKNNVDNLTVSIKEKTKNSKEYKEYLKVRSQIQELEEKKNTIKQQFEKKYSNDIARVYISVYSNNEICIKESNTVSEEEITNSIMLESFFANSPITEEELVTNITNKLLSSTK